MNSVNLMGRITADPELKQTTTGVNVCSFTVAVDSGKKDADGNRGAYFFTCIAWKATAEFIARYFRKGSMIGVTGELVSRQYKDKETGKNRTAIEVNVIKAYFGGNKASGAETQEQTSTASFGIGIDEFQPVASDEGDLPF